MRDENIDTHISHQSFGLNDIKTKKKRFRDGRRHPPI